MGIDGCRGREYAVTGPVCRHDMHRILGKMPALRIASRCTYQQHQDESGQHADPPIDATIKDDNGILKLCSTTRFCMGLLSETAIAGLLSCQ
jgi:hypothetical protein